MLNDRPRVEIEQRITAAALSCFLRSGFDRTTLVDVAREAQVSRQTLYRKLPGKEALLSAVVAELAEMALARIRNVHPAPDTPGDRIRLIVDIWCVENYALTRQSAAAEDLSDASATRARGAMQAAFRRIDAEIEAALGPGTGNPAELARQITAMAQGFKQDRPDVAEYQRRVHAGIETVLRAHLHPPSAMTSPA